MIDIELVLTGIKRHDIVSTCIPYYTGGKRQSCLGSHVGCELSSFVPNISTGLDTYLPELIKRVAYI